MFKRILQHLRPNLVAYVALFFALGGTSIAAVQALPRNSVGTAQLKKDAVVSSKVKADALVGADIQESSLGEVPSASAAKNAEHAKVADSATNAEHAKVAGSATNALSLGGLLASKYLTKGEAGPMLGAQMFQTATRSDNTFSVLSSIPGVGATLYGECGSTTAATWVKNGNTNAYLEAWDNTERYSAIHHQWIAPGATGNSTIYTDAPDVSHWTIYGGEPKTQMAIVTIGTDKEGPGGCHWVVHTQFTLQGL